MKKESVYLETSVISYYAAKPSRDIIVLAHHRDAVHLAVACVHEIDYLISWNCAHIANSEVIKKLWKINAEYGIHVPVIGTPEILEV